MRWIALLLSLMTVFPVLANESPAALQKAFIDAMLANDAEAVGKCYAADAISYDVGQMVVKGPAGVQASWGGFFEAYKVTEVNIMKAGSFEAGDKAAAWGQFSMVAEPLAGGEPITMEGRYSDVSQSFDGNWLYIMDHASLPLPSAE